MSQNFNALRKRLFEPVDIASIAIFRMVFGAVIFWEVWGYFKRDHIKEYFIEPTILFKYYGFEWINPWPGDGMYIHFMVTGLCALCVATGLFYRVTSWLLFLCLSYWFLLDRVLYLNHQYMVVLVALLLALIPAHHTKSLDTLRKPELSSDTIPAWCLWVLRIQIGIVYFYGGLAKLNPDWLTGHPPREWLAVDSQLPIIGPALGTEAAVWIMSYGGLLFDLAVVPALLWKKTRIWAFAACVFFNLSNEIMFSIGIFPVLMIAASLMMFPPDWPRKACLLFSSMGGASLSAQSPQVISSRKKRATEIFLGIYILAQVLIPFRHFLYPGQAIWNEEGYLFSWHMMLREKAADVSFHVKDLNTGETWVEDYRDYLTSRQIISLPQHPDLYHQFAHHLAKEMKKKRGHDNIAIHVRSIVKLNHRKPQELSDFSVDLSKEPISLRPAKWILPLESE